MQTVIPTAALIALGLACLGAVVFRRLARSRTTGTVDPLWLANFRPERYRPMERLLSLDDVQFLAEQPGDTRALSARLRTERRRIFRLYLRNLERDFGRLHRAARALILSAPEDRSAFASALVRQQLAFQRSLLVVRWRLLLHWAAGTPVEVGGLTAALDDMTAQVRLLSTPPAGALATAS